MATYNGEKYIREQLDSLATQTKLPVELVVTDDCSTDRTLAILEEFALTAPFPVFVYRNATRLGYRDNFLKASGLCSGTLIAFCDQDDVWKSHKLELCARPFHLDEVELCMHSACVWNGQTNLGYNSPDFKKELILPSLTADPRSSERHGLAMVFRKNLLDMASSFKRPLDFHNTRFLMAHDQWVWFLASVFGSIAIIPEALVLYRQHSQNTIGVKPPLKTDLSATLLRSIETKSYYGFAKEDLKYSILLREMAKTLPNSYRIKAREAESLFRRRCYYNLLRHHIYLSSSGLFYRLRVFLVVFVNAGYLHDPTRSRPGIKAFLKDLFLGILRLDRFFMPFGRLN